MSAQHATRTELTAFQNGDHTGFASAYLCYPVQSFQMCGHIGGRVIFPVGKLRVLMEMPSPGNNGVFNAGYTLIQFLTIPALLPAWGQCGVTVQADVSSLVFVLVAMPKYDNNYEIGSPACLIAVTGSSEQKVVPSRITVSERFRYPSALPGFSGCHRARHGIVDLEMRLFSNTREPHLSKYASRTLL